MKCTQNITTLKHQLPFVYDFQVFCLIFSKEMRFDFHQTHSSSITVSYVVIKNIFKYV